MTDHDRMARLHAYVAAASDVPVVWGESDCCAWPLRWAQKQETCRHAALPHYSSREEALALIAEAGGLAPLADRILAPMGLFQTGAPQLGDIGIIRLSDRDVGAIFAHGGIALWRNDLGGCVCIMPKTVLRAWSI